MDEYEELYYKLFNEITNVIDRLQAVQRETEEMFSSLKAEQKIVRLLTQEKNGQ